MGSWSKLTTLPFSWVIRAVPSATVADIQADPCQPYPNGPSIAADAAS